MSFHKHQNLAIKAIPIIFLGIAFLALVFFGLNKINRVAAAVTISGSWLQTTDSSTASDGFNLPGNSKVQTGVRGTGTGAGVGLARIQPPTTGWAVGDAGVIMKTIDGGNTWIAQNS